MTKQLIIAEKPSLANNIAKALNMGQRKDGYIEGDKYIISWAFGHLFSLKDIDDYLGAKKKWADVNLPFFPNQFEFILKNDVGVRKQFKILKELVNRKDVIEIVNCGDADREGQVIIDLIIENIAANKKVSRLWLPDQEETTIVKSIKSMRNNSEYKNLLNEGLARTYMDWLLGINLTRYLTISSNQLLPCGRVLIPIVKFIYDRDIAIKNFKKERYYQLESKTEIDYAKIDLIIKDRKYTLEEKDKAAARANDLNKFKAIVKKIESKEIVKQPPKLFSLSKLQSKLSKDFKISFADSLKHIQSLYEKGYITYPRTNTEYLADNEKDKVKEIISIYSSAHELEFKDTKRIFDNSKIESHSAITPTTKIPGELSSEESKIYNTILNRFLSNFLIEDSIISQVNVEITVDDQIFNLKGESMKKEGFLKYEPQKFENKLPNLKEGQEFAVDFKVIEKETTPPKKVTDTELANYLENPFRKEILSEDNNENDEEEYKAILRGIEIGTQATRTGIVENAKKYKYISQSKQSYSIEPLGVSLVEILDKLNINLYKEKTVEFSIMQKQVYKGECSIGELINAIQNELKEIISKDTKIEVNIPKEEKEVIGQCPRCEGNICESKVSFYCENFKKEDDPCKFSLFKKDKFFEARGKTITKTIAKKLLKDGQVEMKKLKSKSSTEYNAKFIMQDSGKYINFKVEFI